MINWLRAFKSANFYGKRRRLTKKAISDLFREIRQNSESPSKNIFQHVKETTGHSSWSALAFTYERDPAFLDLPADNMKECICGFLLLVEYRDHVAVFKSNLEIPSEFKTKYFQRIADERVEVAIARADATFEQIRLRNMASSKFALRNKTLEANDLRNVVGPSGASRYVPRGYRVRRGKDTYGATPDSGKISMRSDRGDHYELIKWSDTVIDLLVDHKGAASAFILTFARPISLKSMPSIAPAQLAIDVPRLTEELFESTDAMQLVRGTGHTAVVLDKAETELTLDALEQPLAVRKVRKEIRIFNPVDNSQVGIINIAKTRISLRKFDLPEIDSVYIKPAIADPGGHDNGVSLKRYIDQNDLFTVLFDDPSIVYMEGTLYKDDSLTDGKTFLSYIHSDQTLNTATDEKGTFTPAHLTFDADSIFGTIVDRIATDDEVLVCDDLGDEWADFIGINGNHRPKTITFYHAKHRAPSLSASALHVVVSQAIKNLSRIGLASEDVAAKFGKWTDTYVNENSATLIPRIVRGNEVTLRAKIAEVLESPDTIRRVFIVTSSLSKAQLVQSFSAIRGGQAPKPHFVQLYQLLMSYFSACIEVGAYGSVICQE